METISSYNSIAIGSVSEGTKLSVINGGFFIYLNS